MNSAKSRDPGVAGLRVALTAALALAVSVCASEGLAQAQEDSRPVRITLVGRVQVQWNTTSLNGEDQPSNEFEIRRARMTGLVRINRLISGVVMPFFGQGEVGLADAYVRFSFDTRFGVLLGQFKRPFDLFVLESSNRSLVIERVGTIRGVNDCPGVEGVCSLPRLTENLQFANRDIGLKVEGFLGIGKVKYEASLTNGSGANTTDENNTKSYSARIEYGIGQRVRLGGFAGLHDFVNDVTGDRGDYAFAFGGDVEWGTYSPGFHLQAGVVLGNNWEVLDAEGNPATFFTVEAIGAYRVATARRRRVSSIEPVLRVSFSDPADLDRTQGFLVTPGFIVNFQRLNRLAVNFDLWVPTEGPAEWSVKLQSYMVF